MKALYTEALAFDICERIAQGETLRRICASKGYPNVNTIRRWVIEDKEGFAKRYTIAQEMRAEHLFEEMLDIADDTTHDYVTRETRRGPRRVVDSEHILRSRLRVDTRKWQASKLLPKRFGDRTAVSLDSEEGGLKVTIVGGLPDADN